MKKLTFVLVLMIGAISAFAQKPVDFRINTESGFSDINSNQNIVVEFPGKSAAEIYNMMAVNIGELYYAPQELMYGVPGEYISVSCNVADFCKAGTTTWKGRYKLSFVIKDGKVLVLKPSVQEVSVMRNASTLRAEELSFTDFIMGYWYDKAAGKFKSSESDNMKNCESGVNKTINMILGIIPLNTIPANW